MQQNHHSACLFICTIQTESHFHHWPDGETTARHARVTYPARQLVKWVGRQVASWLSFFSAGACVAFFLSLAAVLFLLPLPLADGWLSTLSRRHTWEVGLYGGWGVGVGVRIRNFVFTSLPMSAYAVLAAGDTLLESYLDTTWAVRHAVIDCLHLRHLRFHCCCMSIVIIAPPSISRLKHV
ncbi:hypothetical protein IWZ01DRAFT_156057 [Phyllosticta capitalensis]